MAFEKVEAELLYPLALEDTARNYFICYTINNGQLYESVWQYQIDNTPMCGVFLRKTGIVQIAVKPGFELESVHKDLEHLLSEIPWKQANFPASQAKVVAQMPFKLTQKEGAIIAFCSPQDYKNSGDRTKPSLSLRTLEASDLESIIELYKTVFKGFASHGYMADKLNNGRGRAIGAYMDDTLVAVAQSDYECETSAVIVGVATHISHQGKGIGRICFEALATALINEGKTLYLQYDSQIAGALYESVGFKVLEKIIHIENQSSHGIV